MERKSRILAKELLKRTPLIALGVAGAIGMAKFIEGRGFSAEAAELPTKLVVQEANPSLSLEHLLKIRRETAEIATSQKDLPNKILLPLVDKGFRSLPECFPDGEVCNNPWEPDDVGGAAGTGWDDNCCSGWCNNLSTCNIKGPNEFCREDKNCAPGHSCETRPDGQQMCCADISTDCIQDDQCCSNRCSADPLDTTPIGVCLPAQSNLSPKN